MRLTPDADRVRAAAIASSTSNITAAEFDRFVAKTKADALRDAVAIVASEEAYQWRMDRGEGFPGVRVPGAQIVAQRMQIIGKIISDRADALDPS